MYLASSCIKNELTTVKRLDARRHFWFNPMKYFNKNSAHLQLHVTMPLPCSQWQRHKNAFNSWSWCQEAKLCTSVINQVELYVPKGSAEMQQKTKFIIRSWLCLLQLADIKQNQPVFLPSWVSEWTLSWGQLFSSILCIRNAGVTLPLHKAQEVMTLANRLEQTNCSKESILHGATLAYLSLASTLLASSTPSLAWLG